MTYQAIEASALDYAPCRYGNSRVLFRGPKCKLVGQYTAILGGTETYGKFLERPYPDLLAEKLGQKVVNFGCVNAGIDVFLNDPTVLGACNRAQTTVLQIPGALNMSNRFYTVHPRRNDRFLRASSVLQMIYPSVDFTEFNFTRHMISALKEVSAERFELVETELREAWVARMRTLLSHIHSKVVLLWMADHSIEDAEKEESKLHDPLFVDAHMIDAVRPYAQDLVEVVVSPEEVAQGQKDLVFNAQDTAASQTMLGSVAQEKAASALQDLLAK